MGGGSVSTQTLGLLEKTAESIRDLAAAVRAMVLEEAAETSEMPFEVLNAVAVGYSFTGRPNDIFIYIAVYDTFVNLGFNQGASMADPACILRGEGLRTRYIRISSLADLERPFVRRFVQQAVTLAKRPVPLDPKTIVRAITERKRRPRR
jgi:hypothetical protein